MSIAAVSWVLQNSETTQGARLVLIALADNAHDDGSGARPAVATLARKARLGVRQTQYMLRKLEAEGSIVCEGKTDRGVRIWRVVMEGVQKLQGAPQDTPGVQYAPPEPSLEPSLTSEPKGSSVMRSDLWDALVAELGAPVTKDERSRRGKCVKQLLDGEVAVEDVHERCERWRHGWPDMTLTDTALVKHWTTLSRLEPPKHRKRNGGLTAEDVLNQALEERRREEGQNGAIGG